MIALTIAEEARAAEAPRGEAAGPAPAPALRPRHVLALAAWCGLAAGLLEVGAKVALATIGRPTWLYHMSRHFVWLIPLTDLIVFLAVGLGLAAMTRLAPRAGGWLASRLLVALAILPALLVAGPELYTLAWFALAFGLAVRLVDVARRHPKAVRRAVAAGLPAMGAIVVGLAAMTFGREWSAVAAESARPLPAPGSPNVLLIVMDTVRADHLSTYGYGRRTSPGLDWAADRGVRFDAARSTAPWTLPSHAGMFTGRLPHDLDIGWVTPIRRRWPTLAGYLGSRGYSTAGFVANMVCEYDTGLDDGFAHYEDYDLRKLDALLMARLPARGFAGLVGLLDWARESLGTDALMPVEGFIQEYVYSEHRKDAAQVGRDFLGWLGRRPRPDRPFFAFLNYYDAHHPYIPPRPTDFRFGLAPASARDVFVLKNWQWIDDKPALDARSKALAVDCYDDCIRYLDEQVAEMLTQLALDGILDDTLVIITSDHGEGFGEHDLFLHGDSLYRPEIHVPLVILPPASMRSPAVVTEAVSLADLPATVVDLLGLAEGSPFPGRSLARTWRGAGAPSPGPAVAELPKGNTLVDPNQGRSPARFGPLTALTMDRYSYIYNHKTMDEELYDLAADPGETRNLAPDDAPAGVLGRFRAEVAGLPVPVPPAD